MIRLGNQGHRTRSRDLLVTESPIGLFLADAGGVLLDVNPAFAAIVGAAHPKDVIGRDMAGYCLDREDCAAAFARVAEDQLVENVEVSLAAGGGAPRIALLSLHRLPAQAAVSGAVRDITPWKARIDAMLEEAEHARTIIDSMAEGAVLVSDRGEIMLSNPSAQRILGLTRDEITGRSTHDPRWRTIREDGSPFPSDQHPVARSLSTGEAIRGVLMGVSRPDGTIIWIRVSSTPLFRSGETGPYAVTATFTDVTEQRQLEAQFLQSQKLEALGTLAGGVAHDFNNMLTVIFNRSELLLGSLPQGDRRRIHAEHILKAARQSAELTQQLLGAARRQHLSPAVVDPAALVREAMDLLGRSIGEDVRIRMHAAEGVWRVHADGGRIRQAFLNLVVNARDAMPRGGILTVTVSNFLADAAYVRVHPRVGHGEYVVIAVSDTGRGIPPEIRGRIFDPFFTTKPPGKGTGLGLAAVRGIVEQAGGHVEVYSEIGRGTMFKIYLPRYEGDVERLRPAADEIEVPGGTETIVLVEDEPLVRIVLHEALSAHGYHVLEAGDGRMALDLATRAGCKVDLLITDVTMPGMSGFDLADYLVARTPELRVIFMSGYADGVLDHAAATRLDFLEKPVVSRVLLQRVREVLDRPPVTPFSASRARFGP